MHSSKAQTSVSLIQVYRNSVTMLLMPIWATFSIRPHSNRKVCWTCDQCPDGHLHSWSATVQNRTRGTGCPQCCGQAVCAHNSLATKAPWVAAQWDYEANDGTPGDVTAQTNQHVHWHCAICGCKWKAPPRARVSKLRTGCPQCARTARTKITKQPTFAECQHFLLAEWDHQRNSVEGNFPDNTTLQSGKPIFWLCPKCPAGQQHSWTAPPYSRRARSRPGRPICAGMVACKCNSLQALYPDVAAEWGYAKNPRRPSDYSFRSTHLAWWCSPQHGSWQQRIHRRTDWRLKRHHERANSAT